MARPPSPETPVAPAEAPARLADDDTASGPPPARDVPSHVYPLGSRLNERGQLEIGGCDVIELAREFGTPAYVYAEEDMRERAREFVRAFDSRIERFEVIYASK